MGLISRVSSRTYRCLEMAGEGRDRVGIIRSAMASDCEVAMFYPYVENHFDFFKESCLRCKELSTEEEHFMQTAVMVQEDTTFDEFMEFILGKKGTSQADAEQAYI